MTMERGLRADVQAHEPAARASVQRAARARERRCARRQAHELLQPPDDQEAHLEVVHPALLLHRRAGRRGRVDRRGWPISSAGGAIARRCGRRATSRSIAALICPVLLILDLGRPKRFHHMLRVFKVSSPLSVGTWILLAFGLTSGVQAVRQAAEDDFILRRESWLGRLARLLPSKPLSLAQALLGMGLGGYTGMLLAATAMPLWAAAGLLLGPLFLATAVASGAAALALLAGLRRGTPDDDGEADEARAEVETLATISTAAQLGLEVAREAMTPHTIGKPLRRGKWATIYRVGAIGGGMLMPLALRLPAQVRGRPVGRAISITAATLTLAGAVAERFAIVEAGMQSADDPQAYQEYSWSRLGSARPRQNSRR